MNLNNLFIIIFVFGFFILIAIWLISLVVPHKKRPKSIIQFFKIYWSEMFLVICIIVGAYFFVKGLSL